MKLRYTPDALAELAEFLDSIASQSPQGAKRVQARLEATIGLLLEYPQSGVATDESPCAGSSCGRTLTSFSMNPLPTRS